MSIRGPDIPEHLAKGHAAPRKGQSAAQSAREIGATWVRTFCEIAELDETKRVLDIGCGPGRMAIAIGEEFNWVNSYTGFDVNREDIEFCTRRISERWPAFRFVHVDLRNVHYNPDGRMDPSQAVFPLSDATADFAFATSVFTHMFREEVERFLLETQRCLARGGVFLATFFLRHSEVEEAVTSGKGKFSFTHRADDVTWFNNPKEKGKAVAFAREFVLRAFGNSGFIDVTHHQGAWCGVSGRHSQDIVVARKP